jgi:hypothetical protein
MQWTNGNWLVVQGEANAVHAQIGKLLPSKLAFTSMQYKKSAAWSTFNVSAMSNPGFPYGRDEPVAGQFRNWTDGSHETTDASRQRDGDSRCPRRLYCWSEAR